MLLGWEGGGGVSGLVNLFREHVTKTTLERKAWFEYENKTPYWHNGNLHLFIGIHDFFSEQHKIEKGSDKQNSKPAQSRHGWQTLKG